jgi:hypothetical protein
MKFPQYAPDGQPLSYKVHHRASGRQLLEEQTLAQAGVASGDVVRLLPEITAGKEGTKAQRDGGTKGATETIHFPSVPPCLSDFN